MACCHSCVEFVTPHLGVHVDRCRGWMHLWASLSVDPQKDSIVDAVGYLLRWILGLFGVEENWLEDGPYLAIGPMFTEYVSWVDGTRDMVKRSYASCNCLTDTVKREHGMAFVELG